MHTYIHIFKQAYCIHTHKHVQYVDTLAFMKYVTRVEQSRDMEIDHVIQIWLEYTYAKTNTH